MKKHLSYILIVLLSTCIISSQESFAQQSSSLKLQMNQLEQMTAIKTVTVDESVPYEIILSTLEKSCSPSSLQDAQARYTKFITNPVNASYFENKSKVRRMLKFNSIKNMILRPNTKDDQTLCVQKYFLYNVLQKIQNPDPFSYPISITNNSSSVRSEEQIFSTLTNFYITSRIQQLAKEGLLQAPDMDRLNNTIQINYINQCKNVHGSYHMMVSPTGEKTVSKIVINMNICNTNHYLTNFRKYVDQIFIHELAHYLYYFKDHKSEDFDTICRKNNKNICHSDDFVSTYAQSSKEEDYAESFTYRYLIVHHGNQPIPIPEELQDEAVPMRISRKIEYFGKLFKIV